MPQRETDLSLLQADAFLGFSLKQGASRPAWRGPVCDYAVDPANKRIGSVCSPPVLKGCRVWGLSSLADVMVMLSCPVNWFGLKIR